MKRWILGAAVLCAAALGGVAYAAIPGAGGTISACRGNFTGLLRAIDAEAGASCTRYEQPLSWNVQGPRGEQGPQGERGEPASRLWARVGADGNLLASSGVTGASHPLEGAFSVTFDRDVGSCAVLTTPEGTAGPLGGGFATSTIEHDHDDETLVHVVLRWANGDRVDRAFNIVAFC